MSYQPLYTTMDYGGYRPLSLEDAEVSLWRSMKGAFVSAWNMSPTQSMIDTVELRGDQFFADAFSSTLNDADIVNAIAAGEETAFTPPRPMPLEEQRRTIEREGLGGQLEPDAMASERALALKITRKKASLTRAALEEKAPGWHLPFSLAAGFAGGMVDPINIASCFVPVVGEERALAMLGNASGALARAGVRARLGAASGAVGAALVEPIVYGTQTELEQDYGMTHSLMNVGAGAILGAALGPVAGHVAEWWRNKREPFAPPEWAYAPSTRESEELMRMHAERMTDIRMAANPNQERAQVHAEAMADAITQHRIFRNLAYETKTDLLDVYKSHSYGLENGERFSQRIGELERQRATLLEDMEAIAIRRRMAEDMGLRMVDDAQAEINTLSRLDHVEARLAESRRQLEADLDEMFDGDSLYAGELDSTHKGYIGALEDDVARAVGIDTGAPFIIVHERRLHMLDRHRAQYRDAGFRDADELGKFVLARVDAVQKAENGRLRFMRYIENDTGWKEAHVIVTIKKADGKVWGKVTTGYPSRADRLKELEEKGFATLWKREPGGQQAIADSGVPLDRATDPEYANESPQANSQPGSQGLPQTGTPPGLERNAAGNQLTLSEPLVNPRDKILYQLADSDFNPRQAGIKGATTWDTYGHAVVRLFKAHDETTLLHELAHLSRRWFAEAADAAPDSTLARRYATMRRKFQVEDNQWTRAQEESFAETLARYIQNERNVEPNLGAALATFRNALFEMYCDADSAGLEVSPAMRELFNGLMTTTPEEGRRLLTEQLADLTTRRWEQTLINPALDAPLDAPLGAAPLNRIGEELAASRQQTNAFLDNAPPELAEIRDQIRADRDAAVAELDRQLADLPNQQKLMEDALLCYYNG